MQQVSRYNNGKAMDWINEILNLERNLVCGAIGALIVIMYQVYMMLPDFKAEIYTNLNGDGSISWVGVSLALFFKSLISISAGAFVTALLIRPEESYGAFLTGMTWVTVVKELIGDRKNG